MTEPRWLGIAAAGLIRDLAGLDRAATLGYRPGVATWYEAWSLERRFADLAPAVDALTARGAVPQVTWEPWDPARGLCQPGYSLAAIAAGDHDDYLDAWAADVHAWGGPLRIRWAHEMNRPGYPWSVSVNGNTATDYVAAWRHVRSRFYRQDVTNVWWSWCAQNPYPGLTPLRDVFPGSRWVDEVSLDGYNWALGGQPWNSFRGVFRQGVEELTALTDRPITIGETGCPEIGGDKAAWIRGMWAQLAAWPRVRGLLWFDYAKEADWRVASSPAALAAFREGLPTYLGG